MVQQQQQLSRVNLPLSLSLSRSINWQQLDFLAAFLPHYEVGCVGKQLG